MERIEVQSSNIKSVGYDPERRLLEVEFHGKDGAEPRVYECMPVEAHVFERMITPGVSVGKLYHSEIKINSRISVTRVDGAA